MRYRLKPLQIVAGTLLTACGPSSMSTSDTGGVVTGTTTTTSTSSMLDTTSLTSPTVDTSLGSSSEASVTGFEQDFGGPTNCDTFLQNCPPGEKCTVEISNWTHKCVDVMDDPAQLDEPCAIDSIRGEVDNCDIGLFCFDVDMEGHGKCFALCHGSQASPACPDSLECSLTADAVLNLCIRPCNPLAQDCPVSGDVCNAANDFAPGIFGTHFYCWNQIVDEVHTGELNSPCDATNQCGKGLVCLLASAAIECTNTACCQPVCDTKVPNNCQGQGQECVAWFPEGMAPPGQDNIGVCAIPN